MHEMSEGVTYPPNPLSVKGACRYAPLKSWEHLETGSITTQN